ncbi:hypothetical protein D3C81_1290810 [compost metagenome]
MNQFSAFYALTRDQRMLLIPAIFEGLKQFAVYHSNMPKLNNEKNFVPRLRSSFVSTCVADVARNNKHLNLTAIELQSAFYSYTLLTDTVRNINITVCNLPNKKNIFDASAYRGYYAAYNIERAFADGFTREQFGEDVKIDGSQISLLTDIEYLPFGMVLCYDGALGEKTKIFEGALSPSQEGWMFKLDVTNYMELPDDIPTINRKNVSHEELSLDFNKGVLEEELIPLKLK